MWEVHANVVNVVAAVAVVNVVNVAVATHVTNCNSVCAILVQHDLLVAAVAAALITN